MKARAYNIRIEVYEVTTVPDGYGGNTTASILISNSWAKLTEGTGNKATAFGFSNKLNKSGLTAFKDPVIFRVRKRNDLPYNGRNLYLVYGDNKYIIQGIKEDQQEVEIFCTKSSPVEIPLIGVI